MAPKINKMSEIESVNLTQPFLPSSAGRNFSRSCRQDRQDIPAVSVRRQRCNRCPSCIQMRNISEYSSERTPLLAGSLSLLRDSRCCDKVLIYLFISMLLFGTGIGTYLLILESEGAIIEEFDYVSRESWGINSTFLKDIPPLHNPVSKILLVELTSGCNGGTTNCLNYNEYYDQNKAKLRIISGKVLYNFYQDKAGKIFEGRGLKFQSYCEEQNGCDDVLTIGLIESNSPSSLTQIKKLKAFLDYCIMDNALKQCYQIVVKQYTNGGGEKLARALDNMNRKDGTCEYFT